MGCFHFEKHSSACIITGHPQAVGIRKNIQNLNKWKNKRENIFGVSPCIVCIYYCSAVGLNKTNNSTTASVRFRRCIVEKKFLKRCRYKKENQYDGQIRARSNVPRSYYVRVKFTTYTYLRNVAEKKVGKISHAKWPRPVTSRALHARVHSAVHLPLYTCTAFDYEIWKLFCRNGL